MKGTLHNRLLAELANRPSTASTVSGTVECKCPSNIALIKYWGKQSFQIPLNPSLSITLSECFTQMKVDFSFSRNNRFSLDFQFNRKRNALFNDRLSKYIKSIFTYLPYLQTTTLEIKADNSFPHSAGIASSASSFGALALCLCSIEQSTAGFRFDPEFFYRKASFLARLGSGSAARSVYGGFVLWGDTPENPSSSNEVATSLQNDVHPEFRNLHDSILVVSSDAKPVSSSAGHKLMDDHPYRSARVFQANRNLSELIKALRTGTFDDFIRIVENEAMSLHSLMMSSHKSFTLLKPNTIEIIGLIRNFRLKTGLPVCFTLDAGPNVHLLFPSSAAGDVMRFINEELSQYCENGLVIHDYSGNGPEIND